MARLVTKREIEATAEALVSVECSWDEAKRLMEKAIIERALDAANGNQCKAARMLKMHRNTFARVLKETA